MHKLTAMRYKVTATAPTELSKAINKFGKAIKTTSGRLALSLLFDTEQEAINFLVRRAENFYTHKAELREAIDDILVYGCLTIDKVTACIEKTND